ncbi:MAG: translocation/assembly module TamB domain-containing protein, partial [Parachlamydiales bacterium]
PTVIPEIPLTYINEPKNQKPLPAKTDYPLFLELELKAPKNIFIKGRGVEAELKGSVFLKGPLDDITSFGKLQVVKGSYTFSGQTFELIHSSIIFPGIHGAFPELAIIGQTNQKGILIKANLQGPLNAPRLFFTSSPSLPLGSILSLLLFGQEISGISALQALQVANAISALSEGNNLIEAAKKNLGIDRLTVISTSSEETEDPDQVALQIGKYIMKNVLFSFSRGLEPGTSNIVIDVDLIKGFMFRFETMTQEQQNRFTLKWNHNY